MESKRERVPIYNETFELGHQGIESANKLQVLYTFENKICFTDIFKETMEIINEDDFIWENYIFELDVKIPPKTDPLNEILRRMAWALVEMHIERLELDYVEEDWLNTIWMVQAVLQEFWYNAMMKWPRDRHTWLAMLLDRNPG